MARKKLTKTEKLIRHEKVQFETSDELCQHVAALTGGVAILGFSAGKDSVAAWLQMRRYFTRIIPYYRYHIPGLAFVERTLAYYEDFFKTPIVRVCDPYLRGRLHELQYQTPRRAAILDELKFIRRFESIETVASIRRTQNAPLAMVGSGWRANDSMRRRITMQRFGVIQPKNQIFFPVFDWADKRLIQEFTDSGVKLAPDYAILGRSFESIRHPFSTRVRETWPEDYERMLRWFPLLQADELRRDISARWHERHAHEQTNVGGQAIGDSGEGGDSGPGDSSEEGTP